MGKGIHAKLNTSDELYELIGKEKVSRPEATKLVWDYIKANDLQDPNDRRTIDPGGDEDFEAVFGKKKFNMLQVAKKLSDHLD